MSYYRNPWHDPWYQRGPALVVWAMLIVAALCGAGYAVVQWLGPCHTQHTVISYHPPYTTEDCTCWGRDEKTNACTFETCTPVHHPASCSVGTTCDLRCKVLDKGKAEAHPKHPALHLYPDEVDSRCTHGGAVRTW
jgi:hypothetical protein